jgi:SnoaL-like protein
MKMTLPPPLAIYFNAEATNDTEVLARCFAGDAIVRDEGRTIEGLDAIQAWKRETKAKYQYRVEPLSASQVAGTVTVLVRLTGNFPGSPIEVTYAFTLAGDKIASLEVRG